VPLAQGQGDFISQFPGLTNQAGCNAGALAATH